MTDCGVYEPHCGLDNVLLSWGHDEVSLYPWCPELKNLTHTHIVPVSGNEKPVHAPKGGTLDDSVPLLLSVGSIHCSGSCLAILTSLFYRWHREGAYQHLCNDTDKEALAAVQAFNPYDLYSKSDDPVDPEKLKPYYTNLIAKFFPQKLRW
jgi:inositol oxygenase